MHGWRGCSSPSPPRGAGVGHGVLNGLSLLIILYLVRKDENSAYKVGWIALIGLLPLLGGALYLPLATSGPPAVCAAKCRRWSRRTGQTVLSSPDRPPVCAMKTGA